MFKKAVSVIMLISLTGCASLYENENDSITTKESFSNSDVLSNQVKFESIKNWWSQFNDDNLIYLVGEAQKNSPTISNALLNIKNYEYSMKLNDATYLPSIGVGTSINRGSSNGGAIYEQTSTSIQTSWELDLFGKNAIKKEINRKKVQGAKAIWHDAQILVASQTAKSYFSYKLCKESYKNLQEDFSSRIKQKEITDLNVGVGLESPSSNYLAEARISQAKTNLLNKEIECASEIKGLVALTGIEEKDMLDILKKDTALRFNFDVPKIIPADLITQRPDVYNAKKNLEVAYKNIVSTKLDRYPSVSFSGNISTSTFTTGAISTNGNSWSVGPLSITLPIFDGGRVLASQEFSNEQLEHAKKVFADTLRQSIKEVEVSLLNLSKVDEKSKLVTLSESNYEKLYNSSLKKYEVGLANLYELEDAKISYLNAKNDNVRYKKETLNYWIDLYKAVGGGFKGKENEK